MKYFLDWGIFSPINHIRLVNRVYPTNPTESSVPRANKLATLLFYVNSKPAKLVKICNFMAHKMQLDVALKKHGRDKISIDILDAILEGNKNYLHLFAMDFLRMIKTLLEGDDHALIISGAADVFYKYCEAAKHDDVYYIDDELMKLLNKILNRLSYLSMTQLSNDATKDQIKQYEIRSSGLRGLQALASMETFGGTGVVRRMVDFWDAVFFNIPFEESLRISAGANRLPNHSALATSKLTSEDVTIFESTSSLALKCLQTLISQSTGTTISILLTPLFDSLSKDAKYLDLAVKIVEKLVAKLDTRHLFTLATMILDHCKTSGNAAISCDFYVKVSKIFLASDKLKHFPIVSFLDPLLQLHVKCKDDPLQIQLLNEFSKLLANSFICQNQIVDTVSILIRKACGTESLKLASLGIACACISVKSDIKKIVTLEVEDVRYIVDMVGDENLETVRLSLQIVSQLISRSGGLVGYKTALKYIIDAIFGGFIHHCGKMKGEYIYAAAKCLSSVAFHDNYAIIHSLLHMIPLLSDDELSTGHRQVLALPYFAKLTEALHIEGLAGGIPLTGNVEKFDVLKVEYSSRDLDVHDNIKLPSPRRIVEAVIACERMQVIPDIAKILEISPPKYSHTSLESRKSIRKSSQILLQELRVRNTASEPNIDMLVSGTQDSSRCATPAANKFRQTSLFMADSVLDFKKSLNTVSLPVPNKTPRMSIEKLTFDQMVERNAESKRKYQETLDI